jgi:type I restriction enzyme M protein
MENEHLLVELWNRCSVLLERGLTYNDYARELAYLLFLKIADEHTKSPFNQPSIIPNSYDWHSLLSLSGQDLLAHYQLIIKVLGEQQGFPLFKHAVSKLDDPQQLHYLIQLIDQGAWHN